MNFGLLAYGEFFDGHGEIGNAQYREEKQVSNIRTVVCNADAVLFPASGRKDKVVITLSSSEGGLEHAEKLARYLLEHGHPENPIMVLQRGNGSREKDRLVHPAGVIRDWSCHLHRIKQDVFPFRDQRGEKQKGQRKGDQGGTLQDSMRECAGAILSFVFMAIWNIGQGLCHCYPSFSFYPEGKQAQEEIIGLLRKRE